MKVKRLPIKFTADPTKVIMRFMDVGNQKRFRAIVARFGKLSEKEVQSLWEQTTRDFAHRHRDYEERLLRHFHLLEQRLGEKLQFSETEKLLLGAFLTMEYSIEAAALFNPSIVPHPDQNGLPEGATRFVMSLRAVGERHISSIEFKEGIIDAEGRIIFENETDWHTTAKKVSSKKINRDWAKKRLRNTPGFDFEIFRRLPPVFTDWDIRNLPESKSRSVFLKFLDNNYELVFDEKIPLAERVIFPSVESEKLGMEDVRLVRFEHENKCRYFGTYTAYDGRNIQSKLLETRDFCRFKIHSLNGKEVRDKGIAYFPRKVNGKYAVISRQDAETLSIMYSDDYLDWNEKKPLMTPSQPWELVQVGNCGSPIETPEGWLLLTHSVGPMRRYTLGVSLLDLHNPARVIGCFNRPLMVPEENEREGYVPNVLYTCGWMKHGKNILIPYAMSDAACSFAMVETEELLEQITGGF